MKLRLLATGRGDLGGLVPEGTEERQPVDALPVVPCRLRRRPHDPAGGVAGSDVLGRVTRQVGRSQRQIAGGDPGETSRRRRRLLP